MTVAQEIYHMKIPYAAMRHKKRNKYITNNSSHGTVKENNTFLMIITPFFSSPITKGQFRETRHSDRSGNDRLIIMHTQRCTHGR
jgi:hypothetical protein